MKPNIGNDVQAAQMGSSVGATGSATSPTSTSFTATTTSGLYIGQLVVIGGTYGVITANSGTSITVDQWYTPGSAAAASTPAAGTFVILPGAAPANFMALGTSSGVTPGSADTTLPGEYAVAGGGLSRQLAAYTHTTSAAGYTLTGTFTANGSDTGFPITAYRIGVFNSIKSGRILFHTALSSTATLNASGDQLTVTHSITN